MGTAALCASVRLIRILIHGRNARSLLPRRETFSGRLPPPSCQKGGKRRPVLPPLENLLIFPCFSLTGSNAAAGPSLAVTGFAAGRLSRRRAGRFASCGELPGDQRPQGFCLMGTRESLPLPLSAGDGAPSLKAPRTPCVRGRCESVSQAAVLRRLMRMAEAAKRRPMQPLTMPKISMAEGPPHLTA